MLTMIRATTKRPLEFNLGKQDRARGKKKAKDILLLRQIMPTSGMSQSMVDPI